MKSRIFTTTLALLAISASNAQPLAPDPAVEQQAPAPPEDRNIGFTWWNDVPELIKRGNDNYSEQQFQDAEAYYRDAQIRKPKSPVSAFNLGLSEAKQGNTDAAISALTEALQQSGEDAKFRGKALYNLGAAHLNRAMDSEKENEREQAVQDALSAYDAFDAALKLDPDNEDARHNKQEAQRLLSYFAEPPPPEQQQQQQDESGEEGGESQQSEQGEQQEQQQQESEQEQQSESQQQQQQEQESEQEQQEQEQKEEGEQQEDQGEEEDEQKAQEEEKEPKEGQGSSGSQGKKLSEEEAKQLLNLLGDMENIVLQKNHDPRTRPKPEKDW